jgi:phage terminase small subunit
MKRPKPPAGLGDAGRALWRRIHGDLAEGWELDERETYLLEQACLIADQVAALDAAVAREGVTVAGSMGQSRVHPAVQESRQLRLAQSRLLKSIELVDPVEVKKRMSPTSRRASEAANVRWGMARARGQV